MPYCIVQFTFFCKCLQKKILLNTILKFETADKLIFFVVLVKDYKSRSLRWEKAVAVWRQFHCDLKDVTSWMTHAEKVLDETSGEIEFSAAKKEQKVNIGIF